LGPLHSSSLYFKLAAFKPVAFRTATSAQSQFIVIVIVTVHSSHNNISHFAFIKNFVNLLSMKRYLTISLLYTLALMALPAHAAMDEAATDSIAELSRINGADIALYQIYHENKEKDRDKAADYAQLFLSGLDSNTANVYIAHVCDWLGDYYEMDRFFSARP